MMVNMFGGKQAKEYAPADFVKPNRIDYERQLNKRQAKQSGVAIKEFFKMFKKMQNGED